MCAIMTEELPCILLVPQVTHLLKYVNVGPNIWSMPSLDDTYNSKSEVYTGA